MISYSLWEFRILGQINPSNPENGSYKATIFQGFSDGNMSGDKNQKRSLWTHAETLATKRQTWCVPLEWSDYSSCTREDTLTLALWDYAESLHYIASRHEKLIYAWGAAKTLKEKPNNENVQKAVTFGGKIFSF